MRFNELTDYERAALLDKYMREHKELAQDVRRDQLHTAGCFVGAGFCFFGCIRALVAGLGGTEYLDVLPGAAGVFVFSLGLAYFFGTAWKRLRLQTTFMEVAERGLLIMMLEDCGKNGIDFDGGEFADFLRSVPASDILPRARS